MSIISKIQIILTLGFWDIKLQRLRYFSEQMCYIIGQMCNKVDNQSIYVRTCSRFLLKICYPNISVDNYNRCDILKHLLFTHIQGSSTCDIYVTDMMCVRTDVTIK